MGDLPGDGAQINGFFKQADRVAQLPRQQRETWLRQLAGLLRGDPGKEAARKDAEAQEALYRSDVSLAHFAEPWRCGTLGRFRLR